MNLNPFIDLIATILSLYHWVVLLWIILSLLIYYNIINTSHPLVYKILGTLDQLVSPVLRHIRKIIPIFNGIDISPVILLILISFAKNILFTYFYH